MTLKIHYLEISAAAVLNRWVSGYKPEPVDYEWFYDPCKRVFVLKLYNDETEHAPTAAPTEPA